MLIAFLYEIRGRNFNKLIHLFFCGFLKFFSVCKNFLFVNYLILKKNDLDFAGITFLNAIWKITIYLNLETFGICEPKKNAVKMHVLKGLYKLRFRGNFLECFLNSYKLVV